MSKVKDNYSDGACPDCFNDIPDDAKYGDQCVNCTHVWTLPSTSEEIMNDIADEQGWFDDTKLVLALSFIENEKLHQEWRDFLRGVQENEG